MQEVYNKNENLISNNHEHATCPSRCGLARRNFSRFRALTNHCLLGRFFRRCNTTLVCNDYVHTSAASPLSLTAGDPIEVGALAEVFLPSPAAANTSDLLSLSSSKSWYGHVEPGAGMVGIAHSLLASQQQVQLPIMHLRAVNPLVASMLEASAAGASHRRLHMPQQAGPASLAGVLLPRTGVSAFAFQVRSDCRHTLNAATAVAASSTHTPALLAPCFQSHVGHLTEVEVERAPQLTPW